MESRRPSIAKFSLHDGCHTPIFPGIIKVINNEFEIHVNESDMMYLSESEEFKNYSIEDVIGTEWFNSIKDRYPQSL
jgi:hypothetical protein